MCHTQNGRYWLFPETDIAAKIEHIVQTFVTVTSDTFSKLENLKSISTKTFEFILGRQEKS